MRERPLFALILAAKTLRTFCYGALGVLFPVYLAERGFGALGFGAAVTLTLAVIAAMIGNLAVGTGEAGPFLSLEQVLLARTASRETRSQWGQGSCQDMGMRAFQGFFSTKP